MSIEQWFNMEETHHYMGVLLERVMFDAYMRDDRYVMNLKMDFVTMK